MPKASSRRGGTLTRPDAVAGISAQERNNPDKTSPKFQQQFAFVKGLTSKTERKKTRSWVTTQHYRKKRFEEGQVKEEGDLEPKRKGRRCSKPSSRSRSTRSNENPLTQAKDERLSQPSLGAVGFDKSSFLERLGSGRSDPFNSYPVVATRDVHELVDHFYFVIPSLIHRYWQRAAQRPRACWDLFNLYRMHEIPFLGMLHHAAHHLAGMRGQHDSLQIIEFKQRSLAAVNRSLRDLEGPCNDWTIIGVGLLANAERVWGDRDIARMHWGALRRLLLDRGGFPALQHNPSMHTKLVWSFIALSCPTANDSPAYVDGFTELAAATPGPRVGDLQGAFHSSCAEFVQFFNARRNQVLRNLPSTPMLQRKFTNYHRTMMFQVESDLEQTLRAIETGYSSPDKRRAVDNCRMACLIHLNLIMADYGDFSPSTEAFLEKLQSILDQDDDDSTLSAEHLLWTLLAAFPPKHHYERIWKMSRLVGVVKRTRTHTWTATENALRTFLKPPETIEELEVVVSGWDREGFLIEVQRGNEADAITTRVHDQVGADVPCSV